MPDASFSSTSFASGTSATFEPRTAHRDLGRIGKRNGLRLSIARVVSGNEHVDDDVVHGVAQTLAALELLDVASPEKQALELREPLAREEHVHDLRDALVAVLVECHRADDRVGDRGLLEVVRELVSVVAVRPPWRTERQRWRHPGIWAAVRSESGGILPRRLHTAPAKKLWTPRLFDISRRNVRRCWSSRLSCWARPA
jgi:hypothetical protein